MLTPTAPRTDPYPAARDRLLAAVPGPAVCAPADRGRHDDRPHVDRRDDEPARSPLLSLRSSESGESGATTVVTVGGDIDLATAPVLARYLDGVLARPDCAEVIVDLAAVEFLGARGVGVLADADDRASARGCSMLLVAGTRAVTRVLRLTGLDRHVATVPTIADR